MGDGLRVFIAVELSAEVRRWLAQVRAELESRLPAGPVRWVQIDGIHVTMKFLGEVAADRIAEIHVAMDQAAAGRRPFLLTISGAGCFPNTSRPRVVWAGVDPAPDLQAIQQRLEDNLARSGFAREQRRFAPHLTLGRVRDTATAGELRQIGSVVEAVPAETGIGMQAEGLTLFRSVLRPAGAEYSVVHRSPFSG
jgi:2'-5' RNA ligase